MTIHRVLIEEGARIELYAGLVVDRATQTVCLMARSQGGVYIEETAARTPEKIHKLHVDPVAGLTAAQAGCELA